MRVGRGRTPERTLPFRLVDVTSPAGIDFQHNSGAFGGKYLPETLGPGCAFLDYDNDGWQDILLDQRHGLAGPQAAPQHHAPVPQQSQRHIHRCDQARRPRHRDVRHGRGRRRFQQRRFSRPVYFLRRAEPPVPEYRQRDVSSMSPSGAGSEASRASAHRLCGSITIATAIWTCSCAITSSGRPSRMSSAVWTAKHKIVLHAGGLSRRDLLAVPQSRRRHLRGRHRNERHLRQQLEIAGRGHARLRSGRLDRTCSSPTTHSPTSSTATCTTARSRTWRSRPAWRSVRTARRAPAWAWMRRITTIPESPASWSPTSTTR